MFSLTCIPQPLGLARPEGATDIVQSGNPLAGLRAEKEEAVTLPDLLGLIRKGLSADAALGSVL